MKVHDWTSEDNHEACKNCNAKREWTSHGWRYWIVTKVSTPSWMSHIVQEDMINFPVLFGSAIPKCATGLDLLDF